MSPEGPKPSEQIDLKPLLIIGGVFLLSQAAFSSGIRKQIFNRDKGKSVWSGQGGAVEAAHISHQRDDNYNTVENGRLLKPAEHYLDHFNRVGRNGLTLAANNAALRLIWKRLSEAERKGLPPPPEEQTW